MSDHKLVPIGPTPEMVKAAEDAYMPFGDMELAIRMALLAAPAVQGESVAVPQVMGIGRDTSLPRAVMLYRRSEPTDDDVRSIQDALRTGWGQPAEQQPVRLPKRGKPQKDDSASIHGFWEGWNNCLDEVARLKGDRMANPEPDVAGLVEALESLIKGYARLLEAGMDRITCLGGACDPVPVMQQNDPWLRDARAALAAHRKQQEASHDNQ